MSYFDDGRLDDPDVLARHDPSLRNQAEAGSRVRREVAAAAERLAEAAAVLDGVAPRAILAAGPDSRLLRSVLEPSCPVPFLAWPHPSLPGWVGNLDLVVVLAPQGDDPAAAQAIAEAVRRGVPLVVACPEQSLVGEQVVGRWSRLLPSVTGDQLATAVVMLDLLARLRLAPQTDAEAVATALDEVAVECSPHRGMVTNPAKTLASNLADTQPLLWGGGTLAARAARRVAETVRRRTGRTAVAGDAEHLLPLIEAARPVDVFADPFADERAEPRPSLVVLDEGASEPGESVLAVSSRRLTDAAVARGVRVEEITSAAPDGLARYAALVATGSYAATYLRVGSVD